MLDDFNAKRLFQQARAEFHGVTLEEIQKHDRIPAFTRTTQEMNGWTVKPYFQNWEGYVRTYG